MLLIACCQCRVAAVLTPTNYEHNKSGKRNKNECDYMSGNNKCSTRHLHKWQALPASRCSISTSTSTSSPSSQLLLGSSSSLCCSNSCSWTAPISAAGGDFKPRVLVLTCCFYGHVWGFRIELTWVEGQLGRSCGQWLAFMDQPVRGGTFVKCFHLLMDQAG